MKVPPLHPLLIIGVLCCAIEVQGQIKTSYDKFEDGTLTYTPAHQILTDEGYSHELSVVGYFHFRGKGAGHAVKNIGLVFYSKAKEWKFLKHARLIILVDGKRLVLGNPQVKDSDIPATISPYGDQRVQETLEFKLKYSDLKNIAQATKVEIRLGPSEFFLPSPFLNDLRLLLTKLKVFPPSRK
jgi:hypothetical protein